MEGKPVTLDSNNRVYCTEVEQHFYNIYDDNDEENVEDDDNDVDYDDNAAENHDINVEEDDYMWVN